MAQYTARQGDTFSSIAKTIYTDEAAGASLAAANGGQSADVAVEAGKKVTVPPRLYGISNRKKDGEAAIVSLSVFLSSLDDRSMVFFSPAQGKFLVTGVGGIADFQAIIDEAKSTLDMAKRILDTWQNTPPEKLLDEVKELAKEVEGFLTSLKTDAKNAIEELLVVKTHPDWKDVGSRIFIRPDKLKAAAGLKADWKEAADRELGSKMKLLTEAAKGHGLDQNVMNALCTTKDLAAAWPWDWKYAAAKAAGAIPGGMQQQVQQQAQAYATDAVSTIIRYISGTGIGGKLDEVAKKIEFSKSGALDFSLLNGSFSGKWYLPDQNGADLFELIGMKPAKNGTKPSCFLRFQAQAEGVVVSESQLSYLISLPNLNLGGGSSAIPGTPAVPNPSASGVAAGTGSASGSAKGALKAAIDWGTSPATPYRTLAFVDLQASASGAVNAGSSKADIGFKNGNVRCAFDASLIKGFSGNHTIAFDVKSDEAVALIHHIIASAISHYFGSSANSSEGFRDLVSSRFGDAMKAIETKAAAVTKKMSEIASWFSEANLSDGKVDATWYLPEEKGIDFTALLRKVPLLEPIIKKEVQCWFRFKAQIKGYVMGSGSSGSSGGGAGSLQNLAASAQGAADLAGSITGQGALSACAQWRPSASDEWRLLGLVQGAAGVDAMSQLNIAAAAAVNYTGGKLTCAVPLTSLSSLRSGKSSTVIVHGEGDEAKAFVKHLFGSLDIKLPDIPGLGDAEKQLTSKLGF